MPIKTVIEVVIESLMASLAGISTIGGAVLFSVVLDDIIKMSLGVSESTAFPTIRQVTGNGPMQVKQNIMSCSLILN